MWFFESTPQGRLLNRFTYDVVRLFYDRRRLAVRICSRKVPLLTDSIIGFCLQEVIDINLTQAMSMFMISCSWYVAGVCVMIAILPWLVLAIFPVTVVYYFLLLHYRRSGSDLQRLDAGKQALHYCRHDACWSTTHVESRLTFIRDRCLT